MKVVVLKWYTTDNRQSPPMAALSFILEKEQKYVTGFHVANLSDNCKGIQALINWLYLFWIYHRGHTGWVLLIKILLTRSWKNIAATDLWVGFFFSNDTTMAVWNTMYTKLTFEINFRDINFQ